MKKETIRTLRELAIVAESRGSVVRPHSSHKFRHSSAAFMISMPARLLVKYFEQGLILYRSPDEEKYKAIVERLHKERMRVRDELTGERK